MSVYHGIPAFDLSVIEANDSYCVYFLFVPSTSVLSLLKRHHVYGISNVKKNVWRHGTVPLLLIDSFVCFVCFVFLGGWSCGGHFCSCLVPVLVMRAGQSCILYGKHSCIDGYWKYLENFCQNCQSSILWKYSIYLNNNIHIQRHYSYHGFTTCCHDN